MFYTKRDFTNEDEEILKLKKIDENSAILKNFNFLLDYIKNNEVEVTKANNFFARKHLEFINENLKHPIEIIPNKPSQNQYPNISVLYLLLRKMNIIYFETKSKSYIHIDENLYKNWKNLNVYEQYFELLKLFLFTTKDYHTNKSYDIADIPLGDLNSLVSDKISYLKILYDDKDFLALAEMFEFIDIIQDKPIKKNHWNIKKFNVSDFCKAFTNRVFSQDEQYLQSLIISRDINSLFKEYFENLNSSLIYPLIQFKSGVYRFKISLQGASSWIDVDSNMSLETFADAILESFEFDNNHLYYFVYKNKASLERVYSDGCEVEDNEKYAYEVKIGDINLELKSKMLFIFDFGDDWEFDITLENIDEKSIISEPEFIKQTGILPIQYEDFSYSDESCDEDDYLMGDDSEDGYHDEYYDEKSDTSEDEDDSFDDDDD